MKFYNVCTALSAALAMTAFAVPASAASVTQCGPDICYEYDDAQTGIASFGNPSLAGNALVFLVPNFRAESLNGDGSVVVADDFVIDSVYALNGDAISYVGITEFGDYQITGGDFASAELILDIVDNTSLEAASVGDLFTATGDSGGLQTWQIDSHFNPAAQFNGPADNVMVTITDILEADTDDEGEAAWIQKKVTLAATTVVPLPAAAWMFISGLGALGMARRRRVR